MDFLLQVLIPFSFSFYLYPLISSVKLLSGTRLLLKISLALAASSSVLILFLSLWGMFFPAFSKISNLIFPVTLFLSFYAVFMLFKDLKNHKFTVLISNFYSSSTRLFILFFALLYFCLTVFRPLADSDIISSYLPLARSIILADRIPSRNFYDNSAFIIPPVGGPVLFAYYYALSGNLNSESFRFLNTPFIFAFMIVSFLLIGDYLGRKSGLMGLLIIMAMPLFEDSVFSFGLYPDIIFGFYMLMSLYLVKLIFEDKYSPLFYFMFISLFLSAGLFLKYQAAFFYLLYFMIIFSVLLKRHWKLLIFPISFIPLLLSYLELVSPLSYLNPVIWLIFISFSILGSYILFKWSKKTNELKSAIYVYPLILSLLGFSVIFRNYLLYGGMLDRSIDWPWIFDVRKAISFDFINKNQLSMTAFFLYPAFSLFFLIPKIIGLIKGMSEKKYFLITGTLVLFYSWWVLYLGGGSERWLLPIVPLFALIILLGLKSIIKNETSYYRIIWSSTIFSLFSSKFVFWNLAGLIFGNSLLRKISSSYDIQSSIPEINSVLAGQFKLIPLLPQSINQWIIRSIYLLTARVNLTVADFFPLLLLATIPFLAFYFFVRLVDKKIIFYLSLSVLICTYSYVFFKVSDGNLFKFTENETHLLFNYWGQSTSLTPYINNHSAPGDALVIFATPSGLSYYTNRLIYNMEYNSDSLALFQPVFYTSDLAFINSFYKSKGIKFVALLDYGVSSERYKKLKKLTRIFDILDDNKYSRLILKPDKNKDNYWYLYEII